MHMNFMSRRIFFLGFYLLLSSTEGRSDSNQQLKHGLENLSHPKERKLATGKSSNNLGLSANPNMGPTPASTNGSLFRWESIVPPTSVDWTKTDAITVVKTQGQCASCWVMAAADSISMMWRILSGAGDSKFNSTKASSNSDAQFGDWGASDVSAQQICDCGLGSCCQGGWPEWAFSFVQANGGAAAWQRYPYMQLDTKCRTNSTVNGPPVAQVTGWEYVPQGSIEAAKKAVSQQPFLAFIAAGSSSFQTYLGGYFTGECGDEVNHVVLVVGYGESSSGPYWLIKNSWGSAWGENGYMRLAMTPGKGHCGLLAAPGMYPTYFPTKLLSNPCSSNLNPCGAGTCYSVPSLTLFTGTLLQWNVRCICPSGFVENTGTNPSKCVPANPCGKNPNPCGSGTCSNLKDGSYSCVCNMGYLIGSTVLGSVTCVPGAVSGGGVSTVTAAAGTTVQALATGYSVPATTILKLNPWLSSSLSVVPPGSSVSIGADNATSGCVFSYTIQKLDNCLSIAQLAGLSILSLLNLNPLLNCLTGLLLPGAEICLRKQTFPWQARPPRCRQLYEVESPDTCSSIQAQFNLTSELFQGLNPGVQCSGDLTDGLTLCVAKETSPMPCKKHYRVQHGDTCPSVWLANDLTQADFTALNPGARCSSPYFQVGQLVCVDDSLLETRNLSYSLPYVIASGDLIVNVSSQYTDLCGNLSSVANICSLNRLSSCKLPTPGSSILIPCRQPPGKDCGCDDNRDAYYGADGVWYQNYCQANCNFALPATTSSESCKSKCKARAGLRPANDPNGYCGSTCPWPQWNPQPKNWWWFADTFTKYYVGACQDWCISTTNTVCRERNDWDNWSRIYGDCVAACRRGKC